MSNHIREVIVRDLRLDPVEVDLRVQVVVDHLTPQTQVRGRLMGPRCLFASTVEVAYPLREITRDPGGVSGPYVGLRIVVPEASFWEPESPFLYQGPVTLWENEVQVDQATLNHALRAMNLSSRGLRFHRKVVSLRGTIGMRLEEAEAQRLREAGYNMVLAPVTSESEAGYAAANRVGLLILGRITQLEQLPLVRRLHRHPCTLGWLLAQELLEVPEVAAMLSVPPPPLGPWWGVELHCPPTRELPPGIALVYGGEGQRSLLEQLGLPGLVEVESAGSNRDPLKEGFWLGEVFRC